MTGTETLGFHRDLAFRACEQLTDTESLGTPAERTLSQGYAEPSTGRANAQYVHGEWITDIYADQSPPIYAQIDRR